MQPHHHHLLEGLHGHQWRGSFSLALLLATEASSLGLYKSAKTDALQSHCALLFRIQPAVVPVGCWPVSHLVQKTTVTFPTLWTAPSSLPKACVQRTTCHLRHPCHHVGCMLGILHGVNRTCTCFDYLPDGWGKTAATHSRSASLISSHAVRCSIQNHAQNVINHTTSEIPFITFHGIHVMSLCRAHAGPSSPTAYLHLAQHTVATV
jgi:hypothetical protein